MEIWSKGHLLAHIDGFGPNTRVDIIVCAPDDSDFGWYDAAPDCNFDLESAECLPDDFILAHIATQVCDVGVHAPTVLVTVPELYDDPTFWTRSHIARARVEGQALLAQRAAEEEETWSIPTSPEMRAAVERFIARHCAATSDVPCLACGQVPCGCGEDEAEPLM